MDDEIECEHYFERRTKPWRWTWKTTIARSVLPSLICLVFVLAVPPFVAVYADLGLALCRGTILVVRLGGFLRTYFFLIPVFIAAAVALDYGGYVLCRRHLGKTASELWLRFVNLCYVVYILCCIVALFYPMLDWRNSLTLLRSRAPSAAPSGIFRLLC